ncbi:amino acid transporter heavy chain SLC3A2 [Amia ocellicauda]|uniref:amino acid transporter heavy chain SLC3A2 n=1 Tax=Amia ocellicauda TaxID=2972642 RepID=UPI003464467D
MSTDATEVDMKEVELNELEQEKQPMTGAGDGVAGEAGSPTSAGGEKNGCVKVKVPEEAEPKFTGLSKEELLKVAGTPAWVRTRWALLLLFWLGWVGMLAGAIAIIVQAPRCQPLPPLSWWNEGPLYTVDDVEAFSETGLKGADAHIDSVNQLKVKGLVLGPIHHAPADQEKVLQLQEVSRTLGYMEDLDTLLEKAKKKNIPVVLDLTPNYNGDNPWYSDAFLKHPNTQDMMKAAVEFWLQKGISGFQLRGLEQLVETAPTLLQNLINKTKENDTETDEKIVIGVTRKHVPSEVRALQNQSGVDLLLSKVLDGVDSGTELASVVQTLLAEQNQTRLGWSLGRNSTLRGAGGSETLAQLLLLTLPGTPVLYYGDEIGLYSMNSSSSSKMVWDNETTEADSEDLKTQRTRRQSVRSVFKELSDLRGKERSLKHGDFYSLHSSREAWAFLRQWDQSERFLVALNLGQQEVIIPLKDPRVPAQATLLLSTQPGHKPGHSLSLDQLKLQPREAVLLKFPYSP